MLAFSAYSIVHFSELAYLLNQFKLEWNPYRSIQATVSGLACADLKDIMTNYSLLSKDHPQYGNTVVPGKRP